MILNLKEENKYRNRRIIGIIGMFLTLTLGTFILYKLGLIDRLIDIYKFMSG